MALRRGGAPCSPFTLRCVEARLIATDLFSWNDQAILLWGAVAAILFLVGIWLGAFGRFTRWLVRKLEARIRTRAPRDTMRIVELPGQLRWNEASIQSKPAIQISGRWLVTNAIVQNKTDLLIARVDLKLPLTKRRRLNRELSELESRAGPNRIPWGATQEVRGNFWLVPRLTKEGRDLRAKVVFTDQFGNAERVKVRFRALRMQKVGPTLAQESLRDIADPTEKAVASALQAELASYKTNGRNVGGFGSMSITHNGREVRGGGEFREVGTARNQVIVPDPQNTSVESDNADGLLVLYANADDPGRVQGALLERVDRSVMYAPVAYLALYVALVCGFAPEFFTRAKDKLLGDSEFGFSNSLLLLDALLRVAHDQFTDETLGAIEKFIHDTEEDCFAIPERIATIRVLRMREE
jgi:hypothetical protein